MAKPRKAKTYAQIQRLYPPERIKALRELARNRPSENGRFVKIRGHDNKPGQAPTPDPNFFISFSSR